MKMSQEPRITEQNLHNATLDQWKDDFWDIYSRLDKMQDIHQVWSRAYEDATKVGEAIREDKIEDCLKYLAHTFCRIAIFVAKIGKDQSVAENFRSIKEFKEFSKVVWYKYPQICPHCLQATCTCPSLIEKPESEQVKEKLKEKREKLNPPETVDQWQAMFETIYDKAHFVKSLDELGFHLLEEMGEVQTAIRQIATWEKDGKQLKKWQEDLTKEVADTVSFCFSIVRKIATEVGKFEDLEREYRQDEVVSSLELTLSKVLWLEYSSGDKIVCPVCKQQPCTYKGSCEYLIPWTLKNKTY